MVNNADSFEELFIKVLSLINFVAHLKIGNRWVSIILLTREICFEKIASMKSTSPVLRWCVCSGKWLVIQWHSVFFYWWHTHCVIRSALCTLSVLIPTLKSLVLRIAQRYFSHGCQFKSRCFGFPKCCPQNFLRSGWFLCAIQLCFLAFFISRNHFNIWFEKFMCSIFYCFVLWIFEYLPFLLVLSHCCISTR